MIWGTVHVIDVEISSVCFSYICVALSKYLTETSYRRGDLFGLRVSETFQSIVVGMQGRVNMKSDRKQNTGARDGSWQNLQRPAASCLLPAKPHPKALPPIK